MYLSVTSGATARFICLSLPLCAKSGGGCSGKFPTLLCTTAGTLHARKTLPIYLQLFFVCARQSNQRAKRLSVQLLYYSHIVYERYHIM